MTVRRDFAERARSIIRRDRESLDTLHGLLEEEQRVLAARDITAINATVQSKLDCLKALEAQERERRELTVQSRLRDWNSLLENIDPSLLAEWKALATRLREIADVTATNEKIVSRARQGTQRILAILRGQSAEPGGVYDRSGRTRSYGDARAITSA
jgi:flagellar biosynthesis/type III secretory pathway chaperone